MGLKNIESLSSDYVVYVGKMSTICYKQHTTSQHVLCQGIHAAVPELGVKIHEIPCFTFLFIMSCYVICLLYHIVIQRENMRITKIQRCYILLTQLLDLRKFQLSHPSCSTRPPLLWIFSLYWRK